MVPEPVDDVIGLPLSHVTMFDHTLHSQMTRDILTQSLTYGVNNTNMKNFQYEDV
jgi:hypothetical protein